MKSVIVATLIMAAATSVNFDLVAFEKDMISTLKFGQEQLWPEIEKVKKDLRQDMKSIKEIYKEEEK